MTTPLQAQEPHKGPGNKANSAREITGRVIDAKSREGMPFVNIIVPNSTTGTITDFDGKFKLLVPAGTDSLSATYLGYRRSAVGLQAENAQVDIYLEPELFNISEIEIKAGENPAHPIMRQAIAKRRMYSQSALRSWEADTYTRIQLSVDNISQKFRDTRLFQPLQELYDSLDYTLEDGRSVLPVYQSETVSQFYYKSAPELKREDIEAVKIKGVGVREGDLISQFTGSQFQGYNFNEEKVQMFEKEFISPLSPAAFFFYEFYLVDSQTIRGYSCYRIKVKPKNDQDLAFTGQIWISDSLYALVQLDLEISRRANVNWVEAARFQQELEPTPAGPWLPVRNRLMIDIEEPGKSWIGWLAKFYNRRQAIVVNEPKEDDFYLRPIVLSPKALVEQEEILNARRPEPLSEKEEQVYRLIDSMRSIPRIRSLENVAYTVLKGWYDLGKVDLGPYATLLRLNSAEGIRFQVGFRTTHRYSKKWIFSGYGAYGTLDRGAKYGITTTRILSRFPWTQLEAQHKDDITANGLDFNYGNVPILGTAANRLENDTSGRYPYARLNRQIYDRLSFSRTFAYGLTVELTGLRTDHTPLVPPSLRQPGESRFASDKLSYTVTEGMVGLRYVWNEYFVVYDNERRSLGSPNSPGIRVNYLRGFQGPLGGDFEYNKLAGDIQGRLKLGMLGKSQFSLSAGRVFDPVPYALLTIPVGNQTPFYKFGGFNLMNYYEFVTDAYLQSYFEHKFEGLFFNRIPLLRRMKLRESVHTRAIYGQLSSLNSSFNDKDIFTVPSPMPYVEAGFGITNFLYIFRTDFIYRLTYTSPEYKAAYTQRNPGVGISNFGIRFSAVFEF